MNKILYKWNYFVDTTLTNFAPIAAHPKCVSVVKSVINKFGYSVELCDEISFDLPGMIMIGRPFEDIILTDGLKISVPSEDVKNIIKLVDDTFDFGCPEGFYLVPGFIKRLAFDADGLLDFNNHLVNILDVAENRAYAFYRDKKPMSQVLKEANKSDNDYGGHKNDRFHADENAN